MKEIEIVDDPEKIKIIIEETRSKILNLLRFRDMTISELASILNKDISTVFRHIKKLERAGFVKVTGERRLHNVPEKIYGRTARTFILAPESYKKDVAIEKFSKKRMETLIKALKSIGYTVKNKRELMELLLYIDDIPLEDIENLQMDVDWGILGKLKTILAMIKIDDEKLKRLRELIRKKD